MNSHESSSRFTDIFIKRPVLAISLNLLLLLVGVISLASLNVRQYPRSDLAVVKVITAYVGADSNLVRGFVTTPLERVIASADGIDYVESSSIQGLSTISAHLRLNYDSNDALSQIQAKVAEVRNDLPPEAEAPAITVETSDNRFASIYMSFYSDSMKQNEITDYLTRIVQPRLSSIEGVQKADILGGRIFSMRVWLDPVRLMAHGMDGDEVIRALRANNYLSAIGNTRGGLSVMGLTATTNLKSVGEFERLVVRSKGVNAVRLKDIATVELGAQTYDEDVRFDGAKATFMGIWVLPTANSLDVIKRVRKELPDIERRLPQGMKVSVPYDSTKYIEDSLFEVGKTLLETIFIVIIVIFIFIGSVRGSIIPVVVIPLSLIGGGIVMYAFGFSINLLTLLAIVLSVGLVVDDAIVVLENIERYVKQGLAPMEAAVKGARELALPIVVMTLTLATVYAPVGFQGGLTGTLFREFAFTLAGAVIMSGVVALTLSPVMCAMLLKKGSTEISPRRTYLECFTEWYARRVEGALRYNSAILTGAVVFSLCAVPFFAMSLSELAPVEDQGVVFGIVQAAPNSVIDQTSRYTEEVFKKFRDLPETDHIFQLTTPSGGFSGVVTKPWSERNRSTQQLADLLWPQMASLSGVRVIPIVPPPLPGGSDFPVEMIISTPGEIEELMEVSQSLVQQAFASGVFMFADADLKYDLPQAQIIPDADALSTLGLDMAVIGNNLKSVLGGDYVGRFEIAGRSYKVIPQLERKARLQPSDLGSLPIAIRNNAAIPLAAVATVKERVIPRELKRFQQLNAIRITGAIPPGVTVDQALSVLEEGAAKALPKGAIIDYAGESRQLRKEGNALLGSLVVAFLLIFLVLAAQFESFSDPLIILLGSVPLALAGSLMFTFLGFTTINIYSQVGLITLVGLVAKNGILIVEFANEQQGQGLGKREAILSAVTTRFRPVLMTTAATVLGHFPLVIADGAGSAARNSIGITLVTGMIVGTMFTLFVVPSLYMVIGGRRARS
jgi:multidrug efflux pump